MSKCAKCSGPTCGELCRDCYMVEIKRVGKAGRGIAHEHPLYGVWRGMKARCSNPNDIGWKHYGGRGITVCERWEAFWNFVEDVYPTFPGKGYWLDRTDVNGNYEPSNFRWLTPSEQRNSQRLHQQVVDLEAEVALWMGRAIEMGWANG